jgi:NodT family efflux transporter outer membrane factor (OMF) lipoprotein
MNHLANTKTEYRLRGPAQRALALAIAAFALATSACMVGPNYHRPTAPDSPTFKEMPPPNSSEAQLWKQAQPGDQLIRGNWWEVFNDTQLNQLEEKVAISNQNVLAFEAQYRAAKAAIGIARSNLFPTVNGTTTVTNTRTPTSTTAAISSAPAANTVRTSYQIAAEATWEPDVWGSLRRGVTASRRTTQATFADLENAKLSYQATLAQAYFGLRATDEQQQLLQTTVASYKDYRQLTQVRLNAGVASGADVAQAETQLANAQTQLTDLGIARAQFEHAIAVLTGKPPSALTIPKGGLSTRLPEIPVVLPSTLLERRPDIAAAERRMAAANEQIGIAKAAYYPNLTLSATGGFEGTDPAEWFTWPSRFWSLGPQVAQTIFSAGRRHSQVEQAQAFYDADVAGYRQTVLTAFQQVEDNLASLRSLLNEAGSSADAVKAAQENLDITNYQYKAGIVSSLNVIIAQTAALQTQITAINIHTRQLTSSVLLIEALGGGWDTSKLTSSTQIPAQPAPSKTNQHNPNAPAQAAPKP